MVNMETIPVGTSMGLFVINGMVQMKPNVPSIKGGVEEKYMLELRNDAARIAGGQRARSFFPYLFGAFKSTILYCLPVHIRHIRRQQREGIQNIREKILQRQDVKKIN